MSSSCPTALSVPGLAVRVFHAQLFRVFTEYARSASDTACGELHEARANRQAAVAKLCPDSILRHRAVL